MENPDTLGGQIADNIIAEDQVEHIRRQAEALLNRWRREARDTEPEAVLEAGLSATVQFLRAFHKHGERELVMRAIGRLAAELRPLSMPKGAARG